MGLEPGASVADVQAARRRLAKRAHPDAGGTAAEMQVVNAAAEAFKNLRLLSITVSPLA